MFTMFISDKIIIIWLRNHKAEDEQPKGNMDKRVGQDIAEKEN